jgi:membrane protein
VIIKQVLLSSISKWNADRVATMAAAISYFTIFAIGPSLLVFLYFIGIFYSDAYAIDRLIEQINSVAGEEMALTLEKLILNLQSATGQGLAGFIGFVLLLMTAFGLVNQIRVSLLVIWESRPEEFKLREFVKGYLRDGIAIITIGVFWIIYILIGDGFDKLGATLSISWLTSVITPFFQIFVTTALMFIISKVLIYSKIPVKPLLVGSFITSFLLHLSFVIVSYYIRILFQNPFYGAAGTVVLTLFWINLCAQIYLFGNCLTWSICNNYELKSD